MLSHRSSFLVYKIIIQFAFAPTTGSFRKVPGQQCVGKVEAHKLGCLSTVTINTCLKLRASLCFRKPVHLYATIFKQLEKAQDEKAHRCSSGV